MTEEKQIEEMVALLWHNTNMYDEDLIFEVAEVILTAGYRKQIEGEWIKHPCSYECTVCKEEFSVEGYAEDYDPITDYDLHYCPNCGAKMKGGE